MNTGFIFAPPMPGLSVLAFRIWHCASQALMLNNSGSLTAASNSPQITLAYHGLSQFLTHVTPHHASAGDFSSQLLAPHDSPQL